MTFLFIGLLMWAILVVGALPRTARAFLEGTAEWWPSTVLSLLSSLLELAFGLGHINTMIVRGTGFSPEGGDSRSIAALAVFMLAEGALRSVAVAKTRGPVASVPVTFLFLVASRTWSALREAVRSSS